MPAPDPKPTPSFWPQSPLDPFKPSDRLDVGPCAWRLPLLAGEHAAYVHAHPSMIVVAPEDSDDLLRAAAPHLGDLPILLRLLEPAFARQLPELLRRRFEALGRQAVTAVSIEVEDVADLKGGSLIQTLREWRDAGRIRHIAFGHADVRNVEWLAKNTPAHLLTMPFSLADQSARHRAIVAAREFGMARVAAEPPADDGVSLRFALGSAGLVLPVLDRPLSPGITPMDVAEIDAAWADHQKAHAPPAPLERSQPPE
ncbi:MAG: hypothetical protein NTW19_00815 [Planctomycetota bacterium]|nr:hypothetical protein [Planctomycetota bacterium]